MRRVRSYFIHQQQRSLQHADKANCHMFTLSPVDCLRAQKGQFSSLVFSFVAHKGNIL